MGPKQGDGLPGQSDWVEPQSQLPLQDAKVKAAWAMGAEERRKAAVGDGAASSPGRTSSIPDGGAHVVWDHRVEKASEGRVAVAVARWAVGGGGRLEEKAREVHFWLRQSFGFDTPEPMPARLSADGTAVPLTRVHPMDDPLCNGTVLWTVLSALLARGNLRPPKHGEGWHAPWRSPRTPNQAQANLEAAIRCLRSEVRPRRKLLSHHTRDGPDNVSCGLSVVARSTPRSSAPGQHLRSEPV